MIDTQPSASEDGSTEALSPRRGPQWLADLRGEKPSRARDTVVGCGILLASCCICTYLLNSMGNALPPASPEATSRTAGESTETPEEARRRRIRTMTEEAPRRAAATSTAERRAADRRRDRTAEALRAAATEARAEVQAAASGIPGLAAVDIYGNFEDEDFDCTRGPGAAGGFLVDCSYREGTHEFVVDAVGDSPMAMLGVDGTVFEYGAGDPAVVGRGFLAYLASLPYEGASPAEAAAWVRENVGSHDVSRTFGPARFTLFATEQTVMLKIESLR